MVGGAGACISPIQNRCPRYLADQRQSHMPFSRCTLPQAWFVGVGRAQVGEASA